MKNTTCPLCKSTKKIITNSYNIEFIKQKYKQLGINISNLIKNESEINQIQCVNCGIIYYNPIIEGDSKFYETLQKKQGNNYYSKNKWEYDYVISFIKSLKLSSIFEIGCGEGFFLEKVKYLFDNILGSEFNENAIKICGKKGINIEKLENIKSESIDLIVSFQVFEHINKIDDLLKEVNRVLKKGGYLIIAVPNQNGYLGEVFSTLNIPPHHLLGWTKESFEYLKNFGLDLINYEKEPISIFQYSDYLCGLQEKAFASKGLFVKTILKLQKLITHFFSPFIFGNKTININGHSHIGIFKKTQ